MRGSLVHDALYQLMRLEELDYKTDRKYADQLLKNICREDGMSAFRAWYVHRLVRAFGEGAAKPTDKPPRQGDLRPLTRTPPSCGGCRGRLSVGGCPGQDVGGPSTSALSIEPASFSWAVMGEYTSTRPSFAPIQQTLVGLGAHAERFGRFSSSWQGGGAGVRCGLRRRDGWRGKGPAPSDRASGRVHQDVGAGGSRRQGRSRPRA